MTVPAIRLNFFVALIALRISSRVPTQTVAELLHAIEARR